jgi:hypothetical protein
LEFGLIPSVSLRLPSATEFSLCPYYSLRPSRLRASMRVRCSHPWCLSVLYRCASGEIEGNFVVLFSLLTRVATLGLPLIPDLTARFREQISSPTIAQILLCFSYLFGSQSRSPAPQKTTIQPIQNFHLVSRNDHWLAAGTRAKLIGFRSTSRSPARRKQRNKCQTGETPS